MKFQKPIVIANVIFAAISVFYALMFATQLFGFEKVEAVAIEGGAEAQQLFNDIQPFNSLLFTLSIVYLIVSLSLLVFFTQSRRLYYISNYVSTIVTAVFGVALSVYALVNVISTMAQFTAIDFVAMNRALKEFAIDPITAFPWSFIIGIIVYVAMIGLSVCLVANLVWKHLEMKKERAEYAEIDAAIRAEWEKHEKELKEEEKAYEG